MIFWLVVAVTVTPALLYMGGRVSGREAWGLVLGGHVRRGASAYRAAEAPVWVKGDAPIVVRIAAITSFLLGQMVVPGALLGAFGFLVTLGGAFGHIEPVIFTLVLSVPTGLYVAGRLLGAGLAMLRNHPEAARRARGAARWAIGHNVVLLFALGLCVFGSREPALVIFPAVYALVSITQAILLQYAAGRLEAYLTAQQAA